MALGLSARDDGIQPHRTKFSTHICAPSAKRTLPRAPCNRSSARHASSDFPVSNRSVDNCPCGSVFVSLHRSAPVVFCLSVCLCLWLRLSLPLFVYLSRCLCLCPMACLLARLLAPRRQPGLLRCLLFCRYVYLLACHLPTSLAAVLPQRTSQRVHDHSQCRLCRMNTRSQQTHIASVRGSGRCLDGTHPC